MAQGMQTSYVGTVPQKRVVSDRILFSDPMDIPLINAFGLDAESKFKFVNAPGKVYEWLQKVDDRNYQGKYLAHRWPGHQGDTWPLGVVVFGDYFVRGLGVWRRVRPDEISKIQLVREEGRSEFFIIPGYPRIRDANTAPDCRKGPIPTDRPAEDGGNSIRLLNQIPR